jgi:UTP--glucose-1-phosphate uridylyltransferase
MSIKSDQLKYLPSFISKMEKKGLHSTVVDTFEYYYKKVVTGETGLIYGRDIVPVSSDEVEDAENIKEYANAGRKALKQAIMIKLNGGLGTSMGLTRAKSLLEVKDCKTFLEIILRQAESCKIKLALMNSFSTHDDSCKALSILKPTDTPLLFLQNTFPKILKKSFAPASWNTNPDLEWNPPGHGDIYSAMYASGVLNRLLQTPADIKGGHIARHRNGRLILRESAQCPKDELGAFRDIKRYKFFNTNNIWIDLDYLEKIIKKHGAIKLPMIRNPKTLDPRDENSPKVYQIETAMGAAISLFEGATLIKVPPARFFPVKKCSDLLVVRSDRFTFSPENNLILNPNVCSDMIHIDLDQQYYGKIDLFDERFAEGVPSLIDCESLTVEGDVHFEGNITIKGKVVVKNRGKSKVVIKKRTVIDKDLTFR